MVTADYSKQKKGKISYLKLSAQQVKILKLLSQGKDYKELSQMFQCSKSSIAETIRLARLINNCHNTVHLVAECIREKIIE